MEKKNWIFNKQKYYWYCSALRVLILIFFFCALGKSLALPLITLIILYNAWVLRYFLSEVYIHSAFKSNMEVVEDSLLLKF